jgi:hypothetical protein
VSAIRRKRASVVVVLLWAASIGLVTVLAAMALYAMSIEVINR